MAATLLTSPIPLFSIGANILAASANRTIDAAGEYAAVVGPLWFPAQTGTKTLSAAGGGEIFWLAGQTVTFANGATELRPGIANVLSTGLPDTQDVFGSYIGGVDTITASEVNRRVMSSGSKTMTFGDQIAIVNLMPTRGGTDSILMRTIDGLPFGDFGSPYGVANGTRVNGPTPFLIKFDDGTPGWILHTALLRNFVGGLSTISFNSGSTPDEYIGVVTFGVAMTICGMGAKIGALASTDAFEVVIYRDPFGAPVALQTTAFTGSNQFGSGAGMAEVVLATPYALPADTPIGVAIRPTTANSLTWDYFDLGSGMDFLKKASPFKTIQMAARTDQTGAFVETDADHMPDLVTWIGALEPGGVTGGAHAATFIA